MDNSFVSFISVLLPESHTSVQKRGGCNCKRSKCLKRYCECFLANKHCVDCNCTNCHNIPKFESIRNNAIAVAPKRRQEPIGCNCTKNKCLKKYCICHLNGNLCTELCNCTDCGNITGTCAPSSQPPSAASNTDPLPPSLPS